MNATQTKHSELPWHADRVSPLQLNIDSEGSYWKAIATLEANTEGHAPVSAEEQEANAAFIVRACNAHYALVEVLRYALEDLQKLKSGHAQIEDVCGIIPEIRAAIITVTGQLESTDRSDQILACAAIFSVVRRFQANLTDKERLAFWDTIRNGYCEDCGRKLVEHENCNCCRDE